MLTKYRSIASLCRKRHGTPASAGAFQWQNVVGKTEKGRAEIARKHALAGGVPGSVFPFFFWIVAPTPPGIGWGMNMRVVLGKRSRRGP